MDLIAALIFFIALSLAFFAFGVAMFVPGSELAARLTALLAGGDEKSGRLAMQQRLERLLNPLSRAVPKSQQQLGATRALLLQAGYRDPRHVTFYFAARLLLAAIVLLFVLLSGMFARSPFTFAFAGLGYMAPLIVLRRAARKRKRAIQLGLPDALDLAVICVESGIGIDGAIHRVAEELRPVHTALSEEFDLVNLEMRAGKPRVETLRNLAERTAVEDLKSLVAVLIQTDRFGTSIAAALRVHSDSLRTERRQRAEERAAKTTIKMVPALVFFIFPAMFCVTLGPAVIALMRNLLPAMNK